MRTRARRPHNPAGVAIQVDIAPDQVNRCALPFMRESDSFSHVPSSFAETGEINRHERWATDSNFVLAGV